MTDEEVKKSIISLSAFCGFDSFKISCILNIDHNAVKLFLEQFFSGYNGDMDELKRLLDR